MRGARGASNGISTPTVRSDLLAPWFAGSPNDPFAPGKTPEETARDLLLALGLRADVANSSGVVYFTHYSDVPVVLALAKDAHVIGPVVFQSSRCRPRHDSAADASPSRVSAPCDLELADTLFTVRLESGRGGQVRHPGRGEGDLSQRLAAHGGPPASRDQGHRHGLTGTMIVDNLNGSYKEPAFRHLAAALLARARPRELSRYSAATEAERASQRSRSARARAASARFRSRPFGPRLP